MIVCMCNGERASKNVFNVNKKVCRKTKRKRKRKRELRGRQKDKRGERKGGHTPTTTWDSRPPHKPAGQQGHHVTHTLASAAKQPHTHTHTHTHRGASSDAWLTPCVQRPTTKETNDTGSVTVPVTRSPGSLSRT